MALLDPHAQLLDGLAGLLDPLEGEQGQDLRLHRLGSVRIELQDAFHVRKCVFVVQP
jgi:hypothetical protein